MSFEESLPENYDVLASKEAELVSRLLQLVTLEYRSAIMLDAAHGGYTKGFSDKIGEPSIAFRRDSKKQYIGDGLSSGQVITHESLTIHVPENADPEQWLTKIWVEHKNRYDMETVLQVDRDRGLRPYEHSKDIVVDEAVDSIQDIELDVETIMSGAAKEKQGSVRALQQLIKVFRDDYNTVPFDS